MILTFHKCKLCGAIFHFGNKTSYCSKCIPKSNGWSEGYDVIRKRYWKLTHDGNEEGWEKGTPAI